LSKVNDLESKIPKTSDTLSAENYIERIETKIQKINEYLKNRGVKGFNQDAVGGEEISELRLGPKEYYNIFDQYLERIFVGLINTPTGIPLQAELTSSFGLRRNPFHGRSTEFHAGIDFRGSRGDHVRSTAGGLVTHSGWNGGYGLCVIVKHKNGFETLYAHLSKTAVRVGERIASGHVLGEVGSTGRSSGEHLHYEVRKEGRPVNPVDFLSLE
jgi:murein DD-endopeptidase MepM/ murein hydrolase activator NlpD